MQHRRSAVLVIALAVAASAAAGYYFREPLAAWGQGVYAASIAPRLPGADQPVVPQSAAPPVALRASGSIEARTVAVSSALGGQLASVRVNEGEQVAPGTIVAELDRSILDAELAQAQTGVALTRAQLALIKAGAPSADLEVLRSLVEQAQAAASAARATAEDALTLVSAPGDLDVRIAGTQFAVRAADDQAKAAQANATASDLEEQLMGRTVKLLEDGFDVDIPGLGSRHFKTPPDKMQEARLQWNLAGQKQWQAHAQVEITAAALQSARQNLADLQAQKTDPQALQARANAAASAAQVAGAAVATAQANLDVALAGATLDQIRVAESVIAQAEAGVREVQARIGQTRIVAPERADSGDAIHSWTVTTVVLHEGEVASPGSPILHLADLDQVTLTVYVAEPDLGRVDLDQAVQVTVDSHPGRLFPGTVTQIANEAEFTPKNVGTRQERANTVYAVKIALDNADGALKSGMPADADFCMQGTAACTGAAASDRPSGLALPRLRAPASPTPGPIQASGAIEGNETTISAQLSGRVVEVNSLEGDAVKPGEVLVRLEGSELEARARQAQAARTTAQAELDRITAAPQPARVAQARSQVGQAKAALAAARSALADARVQRDNPQELDAQINNARTQLASLSAQIDLARANLKAAQTLQESLPAGVGSDQDKTQRAIYDQQVSAAQAALRAAEASQQGGQATLAHLRAIRSKPVALDAAVHDAEGRVEQAEAALRVAQAVLAQVEAPAQPEAVAVARARVAQADAAVRLIQATLEKLQLISPAAGTVTAQTIHAGEVAQPGAPLLTITDLEHVKLVTYVPSGRIGQVRLGQQVQVTTDSHPGRTFIGRVTHVNDEAEFTPKNVQTQEERVKMVFQVEIALDNSDGALKPGMPADAVLTIDGE